MINHIGRARRDERGFTLIELLIVIVILGVLAGITVFAVNAFRGNGVQASCQSDVKNVEIASEAYYAKNGTYAPNIAALVSGGFLKEAPPSTNYTVTYSGGGSTTVPTISGTSSNGC